MVNNVNTNPAMLWHSVNGQASISQTAGTVFGQSVSNGSHAGHLDGDALISGSIRMHGSSWLTASVFKADDFSANNPLCTLWELMPCTSYCLCILGKQKQKKRGGI